MYVFMKAISIAADQIENTSNTAQHETEAFIPTITQEQFMELCQVQALVAQLIFDHMRINRA